MRGKILGIKKSAILKATGIFLLFAFLCCLSLLIVFNLAEYWFFAFCMFVGLFQLLKACLFRLDSALYLGVLLLCLGVFLTLIFAFDGYFYLPFACISPFMLASFVCFLAKGRKFQIVLAFILFLEQILVLLLKKSLINLWLLLAINGVFLILFICVILALKKRRK